MNTSLEGKRIVLTRAKEQSNESIELFTKLGADVISLPCIKVLPIEDYSPFDEVIRNISFDYIIFPSANSVTMFITHMHNLPGIKSFANSKIVAVGSKTKNTCKSMGIKVELVPKTFNARGVLDLLASENIEAKNILLPSSTIARTELCEGLENMGAKVFTLPIYDIVAPDKKEIEKELEELEKKSPDLFVFTSPSTFENFLKILEITNPEKYFTDIKVAAIGTTTRAAVEKTGVKVDIIPDSFTMNSLVDKIVEFYRNQEIRRNT